MLRLAPKSRNQPAEICVPSCGRTRSELGNQMSPGREVGESWARWMYCRLRPMPALMELLGPVFSRMESRGSRPEIDPSNRPYAATMSPEAYRISSGSWVEANGSLSSGGT